MHNSNVARKSNRTRTRKRGFPTLRSQQMSELHYGDGGISLPPGKVVGNRADSCVIDTLHPISLHGLQLIYSH